MKKFKKVYIETTNICNLSCNFCPKTKRKSKFMQIDEFEYILKNVKPYTDYIYLHLMGEPFLNPELERFLKLGSDFGFKINITTNGTLISKVKDCLLSSEVRQINFSLHSFEANKNLIQLEEYLQSVTSFIMEANRTTNIICSIRLWNMDTYELKACNELNSRILKILEDKLKLDFSLGEKLKHNKRIKIRNNLYLNMDEKFEWGNLELDNTVEDIFCYGLRDQMGILVDGTVVPCCLDSDGNIALGNIFDDTLEDILSSDRARNLYDGFSCRKAVEELCKKCGYARRFKR